MLPSLVASLVVLLMLLILCGCSNSPSRFNPSSSSQPLSERAATAQPGPLLAIPYGCNLGNNLATPFLGAGWASLERQDYRTAKSSRADLPAAQVRFYLSEIVPLQLTLEGRSNGGVRLELEQTSWKQDLKWSQSWQRIQYSVPAEALKIGRNCLQIKADQSSDWRVVQFSTAPPAPSNTASGSSHPTSAQEPITLGFHQSISYPLNLRGTGSIHFEEIQPWLNPGAPSMASNPWKFSLQLKGQALAPIELTRSSSQGGELHFSFQQPTPVVLRLMLTSSEPPLPGQLGIKIKGLSLHNPSPATSPTPTAWQSVQGPTSASQSSPAARPNILLYVVDTLRFDQLRCCEASSPSTPGFDGLAQDGVVFENCTAQSSWTKSSMASIFTGLNPNNHRAEDFADILSPALPKLSKSLRQAGYRTAAIVTNKFVSKEFGFQDGFDSFIYKETLSAHQVHRVAQQFLEQKDKPLFLYLHVIEPHLPYTSHGSQTAINKVNGPTERSSESVFTVEEMKKLRQDWESSSDHSRLTSKVARARRLYQSEIGYCDQAFGQLMADLKKRGLYDNTLVVLVSDHGEQFFEHSMCDHMNSLYQELLHVPLIVKFPQQLGAGSRAKGLWQHIDIAPTILEQAGLSVPSQMEGVSYRPSSQEPPWLAQRPAFFSLNVGLASDRYGQGDSPAQAHLRGLRLGPWVLQVADSTLTNLEPLQLFHLEHDPQEKENLAYQRPEVCLAMLSSLRLFTPTDHQTNVAPKEEVEQALRSLQYLR